MGEAVGESEEGMGPKLDRLGHRRRRAGGSGLVGAGRHGGRTYGWKERGRDKPKASRR